jgi:Sulfotransferase family
MAHPVSQAEVRKALEVEVMMQEAVQATGLADYGDLGFVVALKKMVECYATDGGFHAEGLADFRRNIIRDLVNRLRFQQDLKKHPEILDEDVSDPLVIMGLPRSGTTKLQRLIGSDSAFHKTPMWLMLNPAPFPDAVPGQLDPRIAAAYGQDRLLDGVPEIRAGHHFTIDATDETNNFLYSGTFNHGWFIAGRNRSVSFDEWTRSRSHPSDQYNFLYVRSLLQYLQWQQGGRQGRRWLLKNTSYIAHLEELLETHPNSTLVHLHRHPRSNVASVCKITSAVWARRAVEVSSEFAGRYWLNRTKIMIDKYLRDRDRLGLEGRIIDVKYEQIRSDSMSAIRAIYRHDGRVLAAEAERAMLQWENDNEQGKHGAHNYTLEEFGLSEEMIDEAFAPYIRRFDLAL